MKTFRIQRVDQESVMRHQELLPEAWNQTSSRYFGQLKYVLADLHVCNDNIIAFSTWIVGRYSLACVIDYEQETQSCKVTVNTMCSLALKIVDAEKYFVKALLLVLEHNDNV